jgi:hypothetical protein
MTFTLATVLMYKSVATGKVNGITVPGGNAFGKMGPPASFHVVARRGSFNGSFLPRLHVGAVRVLQPQEPDDTLGFRNDRIGDRRGTRGPIA